MRIAPSARAESLDFMKVYVTLWPHRRTRHPTLGRRQEYERLGHKQVSILGHSTFSVSLDLPAHKPNGNVSGIPDRLPVGSGLTAEVSSNQTYTSNCPGRRASK